MMASRMIGRKHSVWEGVMPSASWNHPHWKTATWAPKAAPVESRNPTIDFSGTRMVRKANVSRTKANPTTTSRKTGRASPSLVAMSMWLAVAPPTRRWAPVPAASSVRRSRMSWTRSEVAESLGPVVGTTLITAMPLTTAAGSADATPSSFFRAELMACAWAG